MGNYCNEGKLNVNILTYHLKLKMYRDPDCLKLEADNQTGLIIKCC